VFRFKKKRIDVTILGGIVGNGLSWFDFTLYVFFVSTFSDLFFPTKSQFVSLAITLSVFASGFFIRPLGGFILGYFGDLYGRKNILIFTTVLMGVATSLIAFIPTYAQIGMAAPIILIILRLLQGFAIGGELNSASSLLVEHAKKNARGLAGSLVMSSTFVGMLLASAVATFVTMILSHQQLITWGWRAAFLFAGLAGVVALFIRFHTKESPKFEAAKKLISGSTKSAFKKNLHFLFLGIVITSSMAIAVYFLIGYFTTFIVETQGFSLKDAKLIGFISTFVLMCLVPLFGFLSDKIGRKPIVLSSTLSFLLFAYPILFLISQKSFTLVLLGQILFAITLAPVSGVVSTMLAEFFPTKIRNSASAIAYNISFAVFGGTSPLIAIALVNWTGNIMAPAWYLMGCAFFSTIAVLLTKDNYKGDLL